MKIAEYNEMMAYLTRPAQEAKLVDDLEPGSLKDELLKDFDPSQETYEEYLRRKSLERFSSSFYKRTKKIIRGHGKINIR
jgi:cell division FtsZ-interacting protein ZapD